MRTTLNKLEAASPQPEVWAALLLALKKTQADNFPLELSTIEAAIGFTGALWAASTIETHHAALRMYGVWCVRQVASNIKDSRATSALAVVERYCLGAASADELEAAKGSARAAFASTSGFAELAVAFLADADVHRAVWGAADWAAHSVGYKNCKQIREDQEKEFRLFIFKN